VPGLVTTFEKNVQPGDSLFSKLAEPVAVLKAWDFRSGENSIATTLAIEWAQGLTSKIRKVYIDEGEEDQIASTKKFISMASPKDLLEPLLQAINNLSAKYGKWQVPWGDINRYQRISGELDQKFDDNKPSEPVGYASSLWGMLPSYSSRVFPGTSKRYGSGGNSFMCAVEFGKKIKAKSLLAGGESGDPSSKHFDDQLKMYTKGKFKDVLFYKEDVLKHAERTYHPGE